MHLPQPKILLPTAAASLLLLGLVACGAPAGSSDGMGYSGSDDPQVGWVFVDERDDEGLWKACDGTTLVYTYNVYSGGGVAVIPDSPECSDSPQREEKR